MSKLHWGEVKQGMVGKVIGDIAKLVPHMNMREVDETREWLREHWGSIKQGKKLLWARLKRREEELLGRKPGSSRRQDGTVRVLTVEQAQLLDENRRLRKENQELRSVVDSGV
jgi:hypothetical protein